MQGVEAKYGIIFKMFFLVWLVQFLKKHSKSKFLWITIIQPFFIKIQPNRSEQEKKW